jgi:hypothetical protein
MSPKNKRSKVVAVKVVMIILITVMIQLWKFIESVRKIKIRKVRYFSR